MIEIAFVACLLLDSEDCSDRQLTFAAGEMSVAQCLMAAQPLLARWSVDHPGWRVARWRCGVVGSAERDV